MTVKSARMERVERGKEVVVKRFMTPLFPVTQFKIKKKVKNGLLVRKGGSDEREGEEIKEQKMAVWMGGECSRLSALTTIHTSSSLLRIRFVNNNNNIFLYAGKSLSVFV